MTHPSRHTSEQNAAVAVQSNGTTMTTQWCSTCHNTFDGELSYCPDDASPLYALDHDPLIGTLVGKNRILSVIGAGGMGVVYKAEQILMQRIVAVKMIRSGVKDSGVILRFQQEAKAVSALSHPNIVAVHECSISEDGSPYLVMEYLDGKTLADDDVKLSIKQTVDVFIQLCDALAHAHDQGIVHRDLKPGNIICSNWSDGAPLNAKILDFGIAKLLPSSGKQFLDLTRTGQPIGSPCYMSPEQCRAEELDARSDIYSLGCVMYKVITGRPIFESESLFTVLNQHLTEPPAPFSKACPNLHVPIELEEIVFKALEKNRDRRYQSMRELQTALQSFKARAVKESPTKFLSLRLKRAIRYRHAGWAYLMMIAGLLTVAATFTPAFRQCKDQYLTSIKDKLAEARQCNELANHKLTASQYDAAQGFSKRAVDLETGLPNETECNLVKACTYRVLGQVFLRTGNYNEAASELEDALQLLSSNPSTAKPLLVNVLESLSEARKNMGDFTRAFRAMQKAKELSKDDPSGLQDCLTREAQIKQVQKNFAARNL